MGGQDLRELTPSERVALRALWTEGSTDRAASKLGRATSTVEKQLHSARRRLGLGRSLDAARLVAIAEGLPGYGWPANGPSASDGPLPAGPMPLPTERPTEGSVREASASAPWPPFETDGSNVGRPQQRITLAIGERLSRIGQRAMVTVAGFALLLFVAYLLERLV